VVGVTLLVTLTGNAGALTLTVCVDASIDTPEGCGLDSVQMMVAPVVAPANSGNLAVIVAVLAAAGKLTVPDGPGVKTGA